ncbi:MAG: hypothetical protein CMH76_05765 [Nitrospinae bacterium]|nr:hypothetical protein [Nitrospinota bacterium]
MGPCRRVSRDRPAHRRRLHVGPRCARPGGSGGAAEGADSRNPARRDAGGKGRPGPRHGGASRLVHLAGKRCLHVVAPLGFVIYTEDGVRIYHPSDTCLFGDIRLIAELCHPQVVMMPVDSVLPETPSEMSPLDAVLATQWLGPDVVIPMHYFPESKSPEEFRKHAETLAPGTRVLLRPEGWFSYHPPRVEFLSS